MHDKNYLQQLRQQKARKLHLEQLLTDLNKQREELCLKADRLETILRQEKSDVDRLEGRSLAAFFYYITGKLDEKRSKEQEEVYAAQVKYDAALENLTAVNAEISRAVEELASLSGCEKAYQAAIQEALEHMRSTGTAAAEIKTLFIQLDHLEKQKHELNEAITAGQAALRTVESIAASLKDANGLATWDMWGGGLLADVAKHNHMDTAQQNVNHLQSQLSRFHSELADVSISSEIQVEMGGFLNFADYFFDGLFADLAVKNHIEQSFNQTSHTRDQINKALWSLERMKEENTTKYQLTKEKLETLAIENAQ